MTTVDRLNEAADLIRNDGGADALTRAVGEWLCAEAATQATIRPLVDAMNVAIKTTGGPTAYLSLGVGENGEPAMHSDTSQHALAVAAEIRRRYAPDRKAAPDHAEEAPA